MGRKYARASDGLGTVRPVAAFVPLPVDRTTPGSNRGVTVVPPDNGHVPYVPTDEHVVGEMLKLAGVTSSDVVYDLGCGDGRIVIAAARDFGARGVGIDIDERRIAECHASAARAKVESLVTFKCASFFDVEYADASVVMLYLLPGVMVKLKSTFLSALKPGTRLVANHFEMGNWPEDRRVELGGRVLRLWVVPGKVDGVWRCVMGEEGEKSEARSQKSEEGEAAERRSDGATKGGRRRFAVKLERHYQRVIGVAEIGGQSSPVTEGGIRGEWVMSPAIVARARASSTMNDPCRGDTTRRAGPGPSGAADA
ncbi:MAG TPA: class I SAM-dependent methyltransferase, partial [Tepidisphaeraceae bacterium]|nr:class I SAM-dependent methyltransferase [Tepidisphaeraceae bacterium]